VPLTLFCVLSFYQQNNYNNNNNNNNKNDDDEGQIPFNENMTDNAPSTLVPRGTRANIIMVC
jgi:hypothetical protein